MIEIGEFENFIQNEIVYQQNIISIIDDLGRQIYLSNLGQLHSNYGKTIKVESMEKYNDKIFNKGKELTVFYKHDGPVTCHAFQSFKNSKSFGLHTDPDDVIIYCVFGEKKLIVNGMQHILLPKDSVYIPANTPHQAINEHESLTLSFGLEKFYIEKLNHELDVLSKNDRNL
jgi:quercetin dioxygenase-like cupin family protein